MFNRLFPKINQFQTNLSLSGLTDFARRTLINTREYVRTRSLPRRELHDYMALMVALTPKEADILNTLKTLYDEHTANYPLGKFSFIRRRVNDFYKEMHDEWSQSQNPSLTRILKPYLSPEQYMIMSNSDADISGLKIILKDSKRSSRIKLIIAAAVASPILYLVAIFGMINGTDSHIKSGILQIIEAVGKEPVGSAAALVSVHSVALSIQAYVIPLVFVIFVFYTYSLSRLTGSTRAFFEKMSIVGYPFKLYRMTQSGQFLRTISLLYQAGVNNYDALEMTEENSTPFLKEQILEIMRLQQHTGKASRSFTTSFFIQDIRFRLSVYLTLADPTKYMEEISTSINEIVEKKLITFAKVFNLFGMGLVGCYLMIFMIASQSVGSYLQM